MEVGWISNRRLNDFHYKNKILWNSGDSSLMDVYLTSTVEIEFHGAVEIG